MSVYEQDHGDTDIPPDRHDTHRPEEDSSSDLIDNVSRGLSDLIDECPDQALLTMGHCLAAALQRAEGRGRDAAVGQHKMRDSIMKREEQILILSRQLIRATKERTLLVRALKDSIGERGYVGGGYLEVFRNRYSEWKTWA